MKNQLNLSLGNNNGIRQIRVLLLLGIKSFLDEELKILLCIT